MSTVRGWLRRFGACAEALRVTGAVFTVALAALGLAAAATARMFGPRPAWQFASAASGGLLLGRAPAPAAANTS